MKYVIVFISLWIAGIGVVSAKTQNGFSGQCGAITSLSVVYAHVDNLGIAPRPMQGSENQFYCIASRDPNFTNQRFDSEWKALNYWFVLFGQELGVSLQPLPPPPV